MIQNALAMCDKNGRFLFEVMPDFFPHGRFTQVEAELWAKYFEQKNERTKR